MNTGFQVQVVFARARNVVCVAAEGSLRCEKACDLSCRHLHLYGSAGLGSLLQPQISLKMPHLGRLSPFTPFPSWLLACGGELSRRLPR